MLNEWKGKLLQTMATDYVVYDLETTGVSTVNDQVVEISAIKVMNGKVVDEFSTLVNPQRPIPFGATNVNGITNDMVADAPVFEKALSEFIAFIEDFTLVGHNIHTFDMKFIYRDCELYFGKVIDNDYIDTLQLSRTYLPKLSHHNLIALAEYYSISSEGAHRALNDCRMNQKIFEALKNEMSETAMKRNGVRKCPKCGAFLKKRKGKFGEFYGCTKYPDCKYTENL